MVVDGTLIAAKILERCRQDVARLAKPPCLTLVACVPNAVTQRYLARKQAAAAQVGIGTNFIELPASCTTAEAVTTVGTAAATADALVVQLPLPPTLDTGVVCSAIPTSHDVDALRPDAVLTGTFLSPVAGAVAAIFETAQVAVEGRRAVVVGAGRLVGQPVAAWLAAQGAEVTVVTEGDDLTTTLVEADVIVSGAGVPDLITPDLIKPGVILVDAATSEQSGRLRGDVDPRCAEQAALFTPVPGGVGPITIATLLTNVATAAKIRNS